jgi:hypothetical protein
VTRKCHARLCVQQRLARSVGDRPAQVKTRSLVARMAGRREINDLKPIDRVIFGMAASHWAATKVNAEVAPKVSSPGGGARNREGEGSMERRNLVDTVTHSGGVRSGSTMTRTR